MTLLGRCSLPLRYCCCKHFAMLVGSMSWLDVLLMATIGERVPMGRA